MKKYVVLGVNENPKYLYYLPLVVWAWKHFGWDVILFVSGDFNKIFHFVHQHLNLENEYIPTPSSNGFKSETIAQVSRLYAAGLNIDDEEYLMTSDVDMLPLSNYWRQNNIFTSWGRDLTDYHYPICYLGGPAVRWRKIIQIDENGLGCMNKDMRHQKNMWGLDQDIVTEKILKYGQGKIEHIDRGTDPRTGYPIGRVDRSNWRLDHKVLIDAHLPHDVLTNEDSFRKVMELLHHVWPLENFKWMLEYHKEFKKLL